VILLDTHVLVRYLMGDKKLGKRAVATIDKALPDDEAFVSAISFWEVAMLVERGRLQIDATVTSIVNRIAGGAGAVFRMALLPQRRAELLHEIHTPRLDKTSLKLLVQNELRKRAGLYIMAPLRNLLDKQGKYGKYIGAAVSKLINVNVIIDIVGKIIDRLPI